MNTLNCLNNHMINKMHAQMIRLYKVAKERKGVLSQADLARELNTTSQVINNWEKRGISERGKNASQKVFGCSIQWLEDGREDVASSEKYTPDRMLINLSQLSDLHRACVAQLIEGLSSGKITDKEVLTLMLSWQAEFNK